MQKKIRVGIFGGTFNPPHKAHVSAAESFSLAIKPDKLLIIPDFLPPHKEFSGTVTPEQRLEMCELAFGHIKNVVVSDMEIKRGGRSYTAVTLSELSKEDTELYFLCGTDMFLTLDSWYSPETIFDLATICYIRRENDHDNDACINDCIAKYRRKFDARIVFIDTDVIELSSSEVRASIASSNAKSMIPSSVAEYIRLKGLYQLSCSEKLAELEALVSARLSQKRFAHTLSVKKMAAYLGEHCLPGKIFELSAAALLHDITKEFTKDEQISILVTAGEIISDTDYKSPEVLHSYTAPYVVMSEFSEFATDEIISAVRKHTVGDAEMSVFDEIIFLSDFIEEGRTYTSCVETRNFVLSAIKKDDVENNITVLHKACIMAIDFTLANLFKKGKAINPKTKEAKNALLSKIL